MTRVRVSFLVPRRAERTNFTAHSMYAEAFTSLHKKWVRVHSCLNYETAEWKSVENGLEQKPHCSKNSRA